MTCCDRRVQYADTLNEIARMVGGEGSRAVAEVVSDRDRYRAEAARLQQLVCDFQAAAMLDVGGQGGPCLVEPKHVAAHVEGLHRLLDAVSDFLKYAGASAEYPHNRLPLLLREQGARHRNQDDRDYWRFVEEKLAAVIEAAATLPPEGK